MESSIINKLKILLISDIHNNISKLKEIKPYLDTIHNTTTNNKYDYILISGDFTELKKINYINNDTASFQESELSLINILNTLKTQFNNTNIIYIPGNHDSPIYYQSQVSYPETYNIHLNKFNITPELIIIGIGGSVPSYFKSETEIIQDTWYPYPYQTEIDYSQDLDKLNIIIKENNNKQFILLSHIGPSISGTTIRTDNINISHYSGSSSLNELIYLYKDNIICNIHGHSHKSSGMSHVFNIPIINPGSVKENRFGEIELIMDKDDMWKVHNTTFYNY